MRTLGSAKSTWGDNFTMDHLTQFVDLWIKLQNMHLNENVDDDIFLETYGEWAILF
jgi:hypothetical protein